MSWFESKSDSQLSLISAFAKHPDRWTAAALAAVLLAIGGGWWWETNRGKDIAYLSGRPPAEWIVFDSPPHGIIHYNTVLEWKFRRSWVAPSTPSSASLSVRALKFYSVTLNGTILPMPAEIKSGWRDVVTWDVTGQLRPGTNELMVSVFNTNGLPALWLALATDGSLMPSDTNWEVSLAGCGWRKAVPASGPAQMQAGNSLAGAEHPVAAFRASLVTLVILAIISVILYLAGWIALSKFGKSAAPWKSAAILLTGPLVLWMALFANNLGALPYVAGFDSVHHLAYVRQVHSGHFPLAGEGYQSYQPPLYYILSTLWLLPFNPGDWTDHAAELIRLLGLGIGAAHCALIFLCLRLIFPGRTSLQWVGLLVAAFVPEQLYLAQYVTNELLSATLVTAAFYFCLRILKENRSGAWWFGAVSACLGAALLTKVTGLVAVPVVGATLVLRFIKQPEAYRQIWVKRLSLCAVTAFLICGWYYARVWLHFGKFIVGNWDEVGAQHWWMERGYSTAGYFLNFHDFWRYPWFSGFGSFAGGLYSTLWGDGLWGGETSLNYRPPWNYQLMAAGYLLALVPTILILAGLGRAIWKFIRQREEEWFLLLGTAFGTLAALVYMMLKVPNYGEAKAFYGLIALLPLCAFAALGWELLSRGAKWLGAVVGILLGLWAMTSYGSFWILRNSSQTQAAIGDIYENIDSRTLARFHFDAALQRDPENVAAHKGLARIAVLEKKYDDARREIEPVLSRFPDDAEAHTISGSIFQEQNQYNDALGEFNKSVALAPDLVENYRRCAEVLIKAGHGFEAMAVCRGGLRADPFDAELHYNLGTVLVAGGGEAEALGHFRMAADLKPDWPEPQEQLGLSLLASRQGAAALTLLESAAAKKPDDPKFRYNLGVALSAAGRSAEALQEYRKAVDLTPDYPEALNNLAWLLATDGDARLRNGAEAVKFATRACELTQRQKPVFLATLSVACAEVGRFPEAIAVATEASDLARRTGDTNFVATCDKLLQLYRAGQAYHQPAARGGM